MNYKNGEIEFPQGGSSYKTIRGKIVWNEVKPSTTDEEKQLIAENKTKIHIKIYAKVGTGGTTGKSWSGFVQVGSNSKHSFSSISSSKTISSSYVLLKEYDDWVEHDNNGKKTVNISGKVTGPSGTTIAGVSSSGNKDVELCTIPRASDFNSFSILVNNNSSVVISANITRKNTSFTDTLTIGDIVLNLSDGANTITLNDSDKSKFYTALGNFKEKEYIAILTTWNGNDSVGETSSKKYTAKLPTYSLTLSNISVSDDNANNKIRSNGTLKISDITGNAASTKKFLQGFSKPKFSYEVDSTTHYTYGKAITISGLDSTSQILTGQKVSKSKVLDTNFSGGTYKLNASDGREGTSAQEKSISISRIDYSYPSLSIKLTRPNALGNTINYRIDYSYKDVKAQAASYKTPTLVFEYTPNGESTVSKTITMSDSSGTITGSISVNYKKSVTAKVILTDMIDYQLAKSDTIPGGQPVFNTKKDSSGNNLMFINGVLYLYDSINQEHIPIELEIVDEW